MHNPGSSIRCSRIAKEIQGKDVARMLLQVCAISWRKNLKFHGGWMFQIGMGVGSNLVGRSPKLKSKPRQSHPYGTCLEDLYDHSWSRRVERRLWIRKGWELQPDLGFSATKSEVVRFGWSARQIHKILERVVDTRSFAEPLQNHETERRSQF